jgi:hypothetical protein
LGNIWTNLGAFFSQMSGHTGSALTALWSFRYVLKKNVFFFEKTLQSWRCSCNCINFQFSNFQALLNHRANACSCWQKWRFSEND